MEQKNMTARFALALAGITLAGTLGCFGASDAEKLLAVPIPDCPDAVYLQYYQTGNRRNYQRLYFGRLGLLSRLAAAERAEGKGRFVPRLAEVLNAFCTMKSWSLPAHDPGHGCLDGAFQVVELFSSRIAKEVMQVVTDKSIKLPPEAVRKVRAEVERRIFTPYLARARGKLKVGTWFWFAGNNNWCAVCHANVVQAALLFYPFGSPERAEIVRTAVAAMPRFLGGFSRDGYCSEGAGYWNYGFGHFIQLAQALRKAPEKIDLCASEKAKTVARYGLTYWMSPKTSPRFADGGDAVPSADLNRQCAEIWPDLGGGELALRDTFDVAQAYICRPAGGRTGLAVAFKGGHNAEFHNHNDLGSYNVVLGDWIATGDPVGEVYTRRTFSAQRYVSKVLNSYAHPVPRVAGQLQGTGRKFAARVLKRDFTPERDTVTLDLSAGYACPALKSLTRTFVYERAAARFRVIDRVEFKVPSAFDDPVVAYGKFTDVQDGGFVIEEGQNRLAVDVTVKGAKVEWSEETVENPLRLPPRLRIARLKDVTSAEVEFVFGAAAQRQGR